MHYGLLISSGHWMALEMRGADSTPACNCAAMLAIRWRIEMSEENLPSGSDTDQRPEVVDPNNVPIVFVDWLITGGAFKETVNMALGTIDHSIPSKNGLARVVVASRLRMTRDHALNLYNVLGNILGVQQPGTTPPQQPAPPKNMLN